MKIVVAMDEDGHFMVAPFYHKEKVIKLIGKIQGGDFVANMYISEKLFCDTYDSYSQAEWEDFLSRIVQRGTLEIVDL
jgi:hypothetical protein